MVVYQDKKNQYWFGSWETGVYKYDGKPLINFTTKHGLSNNRADEIAYAEVFDRAEREIGMKTVYAVNDPHGAETNMHRGFIDAALITRQVPDFKERTFYISGPRVMVVKFQSVLKELGVAHSKIKVDFFPGFA